MIKNQMKNKKIFFRTFGRKSRTENNNNLKSETQPVFYEKNDYWKSSPQNWGASLPKIFKLWIFCIFLICQLFIKKMRIKTLCFPFNYFYWNILHRMCTRNQVKKIIIYFTVMQYISQATANINNSTRNKSDFFEFEYNRCKMWIKKNKSTQNIHIKNKISMNIKKQTQSKKKIFLKNMPISLEWNFKKTDNWKGNIWKSKTVRKLVI